MKNERAQLPDGNCARTLYQSMFDYSSTAATKERHVIEAAEAAKIQLTSEEVARLEALADATGIDTRGGWEHSME